MCEPPSASACEPIAHATRHIPGFGIVAQGVHRDALVDQRHVGSRTDGAVELAHGQRVHGIESGEQPSVGQDLPLGVGGTPPVA